MTTFGAVKSNASNALSHSSDVMAFTSLATFRELVAGTAIATALDYSNDEPKDGTLE